METGGFDKEMKVRRWYKKEATKREDSKDVKNWQNCNAFWVSENNHGEILHVLRIVAKHTVYFRTKDRQTPTLKWCLQIQALATVNRAPFLLLMV